ncbi:DUF6789 family protein [Crenobacter intestini]|uniref:DUF1440 domain-containing protein n=1 Tax=Crenobacter intestini TaxID=2563443 RepID=A0A4T0UM92_9NEIS|nr:DUF6789 family protein [Crenobacter intestini]TIC79551.1 hypothetical protein E5K04_13480 [Crenobacter intestini]
MPTPAYGKAVIAGFAATIVLSMLMMAKHVMGLMPQVNPVMDLALLFAHFTRSAPNMMMGWLMHFLLGSVVWGLAYAWLSPQLKGSPLVRGLMFAVMAWFAMMVLFMPLVGHGLFAMGYGMGVMPAMATLMLHLAYGAVLGLVYGHLTAASGK